MMDERDWLASESPLVMLEFLGGKASDRKLRLFATSCCRAVWHLLEFDYLRRLVEAAERLADGAPSSEFFLEWNTVSPAARQGRFFRALGYAVAPGLTAAHTKYLAQTVWFASDLSGDEGTRLLLRLLRDIFGNPFRSPTLHPDWLTPTVFALAQAAYDERLLPAGELERDRLLILADALEDAGADAALTDHLREPGPHVRGCWVVDAILGRE
jgi:hypothetical protein